MFCIRAIKFGGVRKVWARSDDFVTVSGVFSPSTAVDSARGALRHSPFDEETPSTLPRGDLPPRVFLPRPGDPLPPYDGGGPRRGNNNNNNTMASCKGPVPSSRPGKFG